MSVTVPTDADFVALAGTVDMQGDLIAAQSALIASLDARVKSLEGAAPIPPIPPVTPPGTAPNTIAQAQSMLDKGGTYDWTGMPALSGSLTLKVAGTKVTGLQLRGPQFGKTVTYKGGENGLLVNAPGCSIVGGTIAGYGDSGIRADSAIAGVLIDGPTITDCEYAGIILISVSDARIINTTVKRIGVNGGTPTDHNAYGIVFSRYSGPVCVRGYVGACTVEDVPYWHGGDCHSGDDILWEGNTFRRCARGLFITTGGAPTEPKSNRISSVGNRYELKGWVKKPDGTNAVAETWYMANAAKSTNNAVSSLYPAAVYNLSNSSTLTETGTTRFTE